MWIRTYLSFYNDPHGALGPVAKAARRIDGLRLRRCPMPMPYVKAIPHKCRGLWMSFWKCYAHFIMVRRCLRSRDQMVIREFLTMGLFLNAWQAHSCRHKTWWMVHNLQSASVRPWERLALRLLSAWGFRFIVLESRHFWGEALSCPDPGPARLQAMPHPMPPVRTSPNKPQRPTVGIVGHFRREKSPDWALQVLVDAVAAGQLDAQVLLGSPDRDWAEGWRDRCEVLDTTSSEGFATALDRCDVIIFPYDPKAYRYRLSGVAAEAVAHGCRLVVPDLPMLRHQVSEPVPVGATYANRGDLLAALRRALAMPMDQQVQHRHQRYRSGPGLEACLQRLA